MAEPVSRNQILRHVRGQGNIHFPCSSDHEQDWQPYSVDPYSTICDDQPYIQYILPANIFPKTHSTEEIRRKEWRDFFSYYRRERVIIGSSGRVFFVWLTFYRMMGSPIDDPILLLAAVELYSSNAKGVITRPPPPPSRPGSCRRFFFAMQVKCSQHKPTHR